MSLSTENIAQKCHKSVEMRFSISGAL